MKILALVLSSAGDVFETFGEQWLRLVDKVPNVEIYLYRANPDLREEYEISGNIITVRTHEDYRQLFVKLVLTLKAFEPRFHEFDFIWRGVSSSIVHWKKYMKYLEDVPRTMVYEGHHLHTYGYCYCSGAGFAITPDFARVLIVNPQEDYYADDLTIGKVGTENGVNLVKRKDQITCITPANFQMYLEKMNNPETTESHYRFKTEARVDDTVRFKQFMDKYLGGDLK
jgi:hypothetical protein